MEHEQFEILIAAVLTALEDLRAAQIIVKRSANFIPKGGR
jgi:hypothetical protein